MKNETKKTPPKYIIDKISHELETAHFFGFTPIETPEMTQKSPKHSDLYNSKLSFLSFYIESNLVKKEAQPILLSYELPLKKGLKRKNPKHSEIALEIVGTLQSISDAIAIKTAMSIIEDDGYKDAYVSINSVGDKESFARLERELASYYRKNMSTLSSGLRQLFKKDIWNIYRTDDPKAEEFKNNAPKAMNCLSDISRKHFKEVLEFLEVLEIPYKIDPFLVGERGICVHTIFEIKIPGKTQKTDTIFATGTRYNHISKDLGWKKDLPALSVEINFPRKKKISYTTISRMKKADFYFIQLGFEARLRALNIIDLLRKNKIRIGHNLTRDKITAQMAGAERAGASHMLIMGQMEALEKSVVVRDIETRSQTNVGLDKIVEYLKKLKKPSSK